jgi:hypothetical protein
MEHENEGAGGKEVQAGVAKTWVHLTAAGFEGAGIVASFPLSDDSNPHLSFEEVLTYAASFVLGEGTAQLSLTLPTGEKVIVTPTTLWDAMCSDIYTTDAYNRHIYLHVEGGDIRDFAPPEDAQVPVTESQSVSSRDPAPYCMAQPQEQKVMHVLGWLEMMMPTHFKKAVPQVATALLELHAVLSSYGLNVDMSEESNQLLMAVATQVRADDENSFDENVDLVHAAVTACMREWLALDEQVQQLVREQMTEVCSGLGKQFAAEMASKCPARKCPHAKQEGGCTRAQASTMSEDELTVARAACPHATAKESSVQPKSTVWHQVVCDGCEMYPVVGYRYKCLAQDNTDLCENCHSRLVPEQKVEGTWERLGVKVEESTDAPKEEAVKDEEMAVEKPQEELKVWGNIACDGCDMFPIIGSRYVCNTQDNTDLCQSCFDRLIPEQREYFEYMRHPSEVVAEQEQPAKFDPPARVEVEVSAASEAEAESEPAPASTPQHEESEARESVPEVFDLTKQDDYEHSIEGEYEMHNSDDDVRSIASSDIKTEVSITFAVAEDDANVMLLEMEGEREEIERMRQSNDFVELVMMPPAQKLEATVVGYSMHGMTVAPPMLEDWQLFRIMMEGMREEMTGMGLDKCVYLGSIGKEGAIAEVILQNSSEVSWPESTKLMLVHGDGCGFGNLKLNCVEGGQPASIVMDFPEIRDDAMVKENEFSFWVLTADEGESAFGNMLCVRRA